MSSPWIGRASDPGGRGPRDKTKNQELKKAPETQECKRCGSQTHYGLTNGLCWFCHEKDLEREREQIENSLAPVSTIPDHIFVMGRKHMPNAEISNFRVCCNGDYWLIQPWNLGQIKELKYNLGSEEDHG